MKTVLGQDPGYKNYALAIVTVNGSKVDIIGTDMLTQLWLSLRGKESIEQLSAFREQFNWILTTYKPELVVDERYCPRGFTTKYVEEINRMIGVSNCLTLEYGARYISMMASHWKNDWGRQFGKEHLDSVMYFEAKKRGIELHRLDAALQATFGALNGSFKGFKWCQKHWNQLKKRLLVLPVV
jgi:hypothetical protein